MRICFLLPGLDASGGVDVVLGHADRLRDGGASVDVFDISRGSVRGGPWDFAVATWWTTALRLPEVDAKRRLVFCQSLDARFYDSAESADRQAAQLAPAVADGLIAVGEGLAAALGALYPGVDAAVARNGIDKGRFSPRPPAPPAAHLRVLVEGTPNVALKGVDTALEATSLMTEEVRVTVVSRDEPQGRLAADEVLVGVDRESMPGLYARHDVLLKMSQHEGLGLPCLEAMHVGRPIVVTPFGGHVDYLRHGENGLLVDHGDTAAVAAALDRLARGSALERLRAGAIESMETWPDMAQSTDAFRAALELPPPADPVTVRATLAAGIRRTTVLTREELRRRDLLLRGREGEIEFYREGLSEAQDRVSSLLGEIGRLDERIGELYAEKDWLVELYERQLAEIRATRAYRAATAARRLVRRRG